MLDAISFGAREVPVTLTPAAALERLYVTHRDAVLRYLRAIAPGDEEAVDIAAVVFERAFAVLHRDPATELGLPWLLRTARNAAVDQARRRKVRQVHAASVGARPGMDPGPEPGYLARERAEALTAALATLPEPTREALVLRYGLGLPAREIGQVIGKGEAATQKLITRGLARLREVLDGAA